MGRKSTFSQLPAEVADYFHSLLSNGKYTQTQIADYLNTLLEELGEQPVITRDIVQKQAKNYQETRSSTIGAVLGRGAQSSGCRGHSFPKKAVPEHSQPL